MMFPRFFTKKSGGGMGIDLCVTFRRNPAFAGLPWFVLDNLWQSDTYFKIYY